MCALQIQPTSYVWKAPTFPNQTTSSPPFRPQLIRVHQEPQHHSRLRLYPTFILCLFFASTTDRNTRTDLWSFRCFCIANTWESAWRHDPCREQLTHNREPIPLLWGRLTTSLPLPTELLTPEIRPLCIHILHRHRKWQNTQRYTNTHTHTQVTPLQNAHASTQVSAHEYACRHTLSQWPSVYLEDQPLKYKLWSLSYLEVYFLPGQLRLVSLAAEAEWGSICPEHNSNTNINPDSLLSQKETESPCERSHKHAQNESHLYKQSCSEYLSHTI